jgi:diketogulonate reductase-like aldo/keto reductase
MAKIHTPIPNLKLNDGNSIPMVPSLPGPKCLSEQTPANTLAHQLGYGTGTAWYKHGDESKLDQACVDAAKMSLSMGYYHQDGAEVYKTETELGTAIKQSGVAREKIFLTSKVISNIADIPGALKTSLGKLGVEYLDL